MKFLKSAVAEIVSLFVDDPWFAGLIVLWAVAVRFGHGVLPRSASGPVLFAGFAAILIVFTTRRAAGSRRPG